jgi:glycerol-3-phosphate dehydrogenase (NAD(P)+)
MDNIPLLVIGAGSWGTALALVLARNGHAVFLWDVSESHISALQKDRANNRHLPGTPFPDNLYPVSQLAPLPEGVTDIVVVVPCEALKPVLLSLKPVIRADVRLCLACKGFESDTLTLNDQLVGQVLGNVPVAVLSGPSFAREVAVGLPTAVTIASADRNTAAHFSALFLNETFRPYTQDDVIGVQVGGAVKNVMAIAAGIADGLGFGANTRAALITRGLAEIIRLGVAMGGRPETFMGLSGLGDLVLTCTDNQSRNRRFGMALAQGKNPDEIRQQIGQAVEGVSTASSVSRLASHYQVDMPICEQVQKVIEGRINVRDAVHELLARRPGSELD